MLPQFYHVVVRSSDIKEKKKYRRVNIYEFKSEGFPRQSSGEIHPTAHLASQTNERKAKSNKLKFPMMYLKCKSGCASIPKIASKIGNIN